MSSLLLTDRMKLYLVFLHLITVALGVEVYILGVQNQRMKERQDYFAGGSLKEGDAFVTDGLIAATAVRGHSSEMSGRQLIFVFSTKCKFCKASIEKWHEIVLRAKKQNLTVFAISMDSVSITRLYVEHNRLSDCDVFVPVNVREFSRQNRIVGVPVTILRSQVGTVESVWTGSIEQQQKEEIMNKISS